MTIGKEYDIVQNHYAKAKGKTKSQKSKGMICNNLRSKFLLIMAQEKRPQGIHDPESDTNVDEDAEDSDSDSGKEDEDEDGEDEDDDEGEHEELDDIKSAPIDGEFLVLCPAF